MIIRNKQKMDTTAADFVGNENEDVVNNTNNNNDDDVTHHNDTILLYSITQDIVVVPALGSIVVNDGEDIPPALVANTGNRTYLVTYSQINHNIFPTRASFGFACVGAFGGNNVDYFAVGKEPHHQTGGYHYHVAIKLSKVMRWKSARDFLVETFNVDVNFAVAPYEGMYSGAFRYATKTDSRNAFYGNCNKRHPNLDMIGQNRVPVTANLAYRERRQSARAADPPPKRKRMTKGDVATFCTSNDIRTELQLMNVAKERRDAGDTALNDFVFALQRTRREELVADAWRMEAAERLLQEQNVDRIQLLRQHSSLEDCECNGLWLRLALDLLQKNGIDSIQFSAALQETMRLGRGKHRNIILVGRADCGKSFMFEPVNNAIPQTFQNPAKSVFGWLGVENANCIFLNDLRWFPPKVSGYFIAWDDLLKLLEGAHVRLPAPMNAKSSHLEITKKMPILATSLDVVRYYISNVDEPQTERHVCENEMMESRWNVFRFTYQLKKEEKVENVPQCKVCFSKLVLGNYTVAN